MPEDNELTVDQEIEAVDAKLQSLGQELEQTKNTEAAAETPETVEESPDFDISTAVKSALASMPRADREALLEDLGYPSLDYKTIGKDKEEVAEVAKRATMEEALSGITSVDPSELPEGFDDASPSEQNAILVKIAATKEAQRIAAEAIAPIQQEFRNQQNAMLLDATAQQWAQETGSPEAAGEIRQLLGQMSPQQIEMYRSEVESGGGLFSNMIAQQVRNISANFQKEVEKKEEIPLPKTEPVGGGDVDDTPSLTGIAKENYERAKADGLMDKDQLRSYAKKLQGAV